jgi:excinuclease UvrABC helicase subunit UvrB
LVGNIKNNVYQLCAPKPRIEKTIDTRTVYARGAFNVYGDVIRHLNQPPPDHLDDRVTLSYDRWEGIKYLNAFAEYARANNIKLYFIYPNYPETQYVVNKEVILKFASDMQRELKIQILNNPVDFVFPDSLFFNTIYHLNKTGRDKRTDLFIEILKKREISGKNSAKDDQKR